MSEQAGPSVDAIHERQAALASRRAEIAEADRVLAEALAVAHAATREGIGKLDAIAAEIDCAVADFPVDTPLGKLEFHKFLLAKQHEIEIVVARAHESDRANSAALQRLRGEYGQR